MDDDYVLLCDAEPLIEELLDQAHHFGQTRRQRAFEATLRAVRHRKLEIQRESYG